MLFKEIAFRVQFNVEFPRQVMNFPIKSPLSKGTLCHLIWSSTKILTIFTIFAISAKKETNDQFI